VSTGSVQMLELQMLITSGLLQVLWVKDKLSSLLTSVTFIGTMVAVVDVQVSELHHSSYLGDQTDSLHASGRKLDSKVVTS